MVKPAEVKNVSEKKWDFKCGMFVDANWAGLSTTETADLLGFLHITITRVYEVTPNNHVSKPRNAEKHL